MSRNTTLLALILATFLLAHTSASTQTSPDETPIGHWVAEHPSQSGIGSWWDFRSDGTFTMHIGAVVTFPITRSGNSFTSPPATTTGPPITVTYHVDADILHIESPNAPEQTFTRIGSAPSATDPLLGKWKPIPPANPSPDPSLAAQQKVMANATLAFSADNTESLRVPLTSSEGTWSASTHTFQLEHVATSYSYQRTGLKLSLGQPPDNKKTDTYLPDPIL
jgi:hypothetical protein